MLPCEGQRTDGRRPLQVRVQSVRRHSGRGEAKQDEEDGGKMSGGGRIAVFGNDGSSPPPSQPPPPARPPATERQDPSAMPPEWELLDHVIASTRVVDERSALVSGLLRDLANPGAERDGLHAISTENDIHAAYMRLSDALYAQRRAAVLLWRTRYKRPWWDPRCKYCPSQNLGLDFVACHQGQILGPNGCYDCLYPPPPVWGCQRPGSYHDRQPQGEIKNHGHANQSKRHILF